jgi:hypothetical protein
VVKGAKTMLQNQLRKVPDQESKDATRIFDITDITDELQNRANERDFREPL